MYVGAEGYKKVGSEERIDIKNGVLLERWY